MNAGCVHNPEYECRECILYRQYAQSYLKNQTKINSQIAQIVKESNPLIKDKK